MPTAKEERIMCYRHTGKIDVFEMDLSPLDERISEDDLLDDLGETLFCSIVSARKTQTPLEYKHPENPPQPLLRQLKKWTLRKLASHGRAATDAEERD
jgi:hypothetical protein